MLHSNAAVCADTCSHKDKEQTIFESLYVYSRCRGVLDKTELRKLYLGVGVTVNVSTNIIATRD